MAFLKFIFGSAEKESEKKVSYSKLSTSRKFSMEFNQGEEILQRFENQILSR